MNKKEALINNNIAKQAKLGQATPNETEIAKVNKFTLAPLEENEVFIFKLQVCDNEVDRDFEFFTKEAIHGMADLYLGKPIIKDHEVKADNQVGRIYDTEVRVSDTEYASTGEPYTQLVASAYVLNTEKNQELISEIKGGIKKEVSLRGVYGSYECTICGKDNNKEVCEHLWGREYHGQKCHFKIGDPVDAFEVSFVAIPAQERAGTIRKMAKGPNDVKEKKQAKAPQDSGLVEKQLEIELKTKQFYIETEKGSMKNE